MENLITRGRTTLVALGDPPPGINTSEVNRYADINICILGLNDMNANYKNAQVQNFYHTRQRGVQKKNYYLFKSAYFPRITCPQKATCCNHTPFLSSNKHQKITEGYKYVGDKMPDYTNHVWQVDLGDYTDH